MTITSDARKMLRRAAFGLALGGTLAAAGVLPVARGSAQGAQTARQRQAPAPEQQALDDMLVKAQADIDNKDYAGAAELYEAYLAKRPQDAQIHFQLGYAYTALQRNDDARAEYQKAADFDPEMSAAFLNLGLSELDKSPAAAVAPLERAVELMPDQARPELYLASALAASGQTNEAIVQYRAAEKIDANDFDTHYGLAAALEKTNQLADAEREFRAAIALKPRDPASHLNLGLCLIGENQNDAGAAELRVYLQAKPDDKQTRLRLAKALVDAGRYDDALGELNRLDAAGGATRDTLWLRYNALKSEKRLDEATAALATITQVAPAPEYHDLLGQTYFNKKDYAAAAREFASELSEKPNDAAALKELASAEYLAKDYGSALKTIAALEKTEKLPPPTLFVRADCYDKLGAKPEALAAYQEFLAANADQNSDMYFAATERVRDLRRETGKK
jgi:tetratricopeptide (TPR) repeat protein